MYRDYNGKKINTYSVYSVYQVKIVDQIDFCTGIRAGQEKGEKGECTMTTARLDENKMDDSWLQRIP